MSALDGKVVAVAGATGPAGQAVLRRLAAGGAVVAAAGTDRGRLDTALDAARAAAPGAQVGGDVVDLVDPQAARDWAGRIEAEHGRVDGLLHLVGGWRGGKHFADTDLGDWDFLYERVVRTLQHSTLAFQPALLRSPAGRFAMVSATAAHRPTAGGAAYATAKAAGEAWVLSLADSFAKEPGEGAPRTAAAAILVIKALVTPEMRKQRPDAKFPGFTDTADLADTVAGLWDRPADELNGQHLWLTPR